METPLTIDITNINNGSPGLLHLELPTAMNIQSLPGAGGLQLVFRSEGEIRLVAEIVTADQEILRVAVSETQGGQLRVESTGRSAQYSGVQVRPAPSILASGANMLDVYFLIDATTRQTAPERVGLTSLVGDPAWPALAEKLAAIPGAMASAPVDPASGTPTSGTPPSSTDIRCGIAAFADFDSWTLHPAAPDARMLRPFRAADITTTLSSIPVPNVGDYVDALAEGLDAALHVGWREDARKLLVVLGDSPGHSVLAAVPRHASRNAHLRQAVAGGSLRLADSRIRRRDVHECAEQLHAHGIEIATLFFEDGARSIEMSSAAGQQLVDHTRRQYRELASLPQWAFRIDGSSDLAELGAVLKARPSVIGRGFCPGFAI